MVRLPGSCSKLIARPACVWLGVSRKTDLGPGRRGIRGVALHLWDVDVFGDRPVESRFLWASAWAVFWSELAPPKVSDVCSFLIEFAGRHPQRGLRVDRGFVLVPIMRTQVQALLIRYSASCLLLKDRPMGWGC